MYQNGGRGGVIVDSDLVCLRLEIQRGQQGRFEVKRREEKREKDSPS